MRKKKKKRKKKEKRKKNFFFFSFFTLMWSVEAQECPRARRAGTRRAASSEHSTKCLRAEVSSAADSTHSSTETGRVRPTALLRSAPRTQHTATDSNNNTNICPNKKTPLKQNFLKKKLKIFFENVYDSFSKSILDHRHLTILC